MGHYASEYDSEEQFRTKSRIATDKLLSRLLKHHAIEEVKIEPEVPLIPEPKPICAVPSVNAIQEVVSKYYSVTIRDLTSARKPLSIVFPRQVAYYLCRHLTGASLPSIGRLFGGRDHTTIIYGVNKIQHLLPRRADVAWDVAYLTRLVGGEPR